MRRTTSKRVTWKEPETHFAKKHPHPYCGESFGMNPDDMEPGSLWAVKATLIKSSRYRADTYEQHELPYAHPVAWSYGGDPVLADNNEFILYLGTVRVTEQRDRRSMSVLRHTFLGKSGRFMVTDFTTLSKVQ